MNPIIILAVTMVISLAGNAALGYLYLDQRDSTVMAEGQRDQARGAADTCSKSVDELVEKSADRAKKAIVARKAAAASAATHDARSDEILSTPATSTDDCQAAQDRSTAWLKGRP